MVVCLLGRRRQEDVVSVKQYLEGQSGMVCVCAASDAGGRESMMTVDVWCLGGGGW